MNQNYKDLTPFVDDIKKALPFFLPSKVKNMIADVIFYMLSI